MKVLFALNNENVSEEIVKKYQKDYKEIISYKNVYYFNAIIKEMQRDKSYDRIVIGEDLEPFANNNYDTIDKFLFEKLDNISDEATDNGEKEAQIILICSDRRTKSDSLLVKLFGIGIYSAIVGKDRSIEEVCRLINNPRTKKDAKQYYSIDSDDVSYKAENDTDVNENEIQSILKHYKSLGRNEERYVDSFNNIASQYTDAQLRIIIKFLPLNVKAVLEAKSAKYQQVVMFGDRQYKMKNTANIVKPVEYDEVKSRSKEKISNNDKLVIESLEKRVNNPVTGQPIIIPSAVKSEKSFEVERKLQNIESERANKKVIEEPQRNIETYQESQKVTQEVTPIAQEKRGRGRPKKVVENIEEVITEPVKKGRGRPRKVVEDTVNLFDIAEQQENILPGIEEEDFGETISEKQETILPGIEEKEENINSRISNNVVHSEEIPMQSYTQSNEIKQNSYSEYQTLQRPNTVNNYDYERVTQLETKENQYNSYGLDNLVTGDKKVVAFVGSAKNGTSFIVNNIATLLSSMGINTAILDVTQNKNSYYIYTKNEEELRKIAYTSIEKLNDGMSEGIRVSKNLSVYTSMPGEELEYENVPNIIKTLANNHSLVLMDCDLNTKKEYFEIAQEIYLVQSMDILTIQPLTAFMRELKNAGLLNPEKLRIVINKNIKIRGLNEKNLIGGMAFYNSPSMSFMTELFNKEKIRFCKIPLDIEAYAIYLEGLVSCEISLNKYSKLIMQSLKELAQMVYPLLNKPTYRPREIKSNTQTSYGGHFSNNMNSTLEQMNRMRNGY